MAVSRKKLRQERDKLLKRLDAIEESLEKLPHEPKHEQGDYGYDFDREMAWVKISNSYYFEDGSAYECHRSTVTGKASNMFANWRRWNQEAQSFSIDAGTHMEVAANISATGSIRIQLKHPSIYMPVEKVHRLCRGLLNLTRTSQKETHRCS